MKKIIKKSKYILISGMVLVFSVILSSKWMSSPIEKALADAPACLPPNEQFTNGCFTPNQLRIWIDGGGDGGGAGDSGGGAGGSAGGS